MDKYLLLFGFQLSQTVVLGALDSALWRALTDGAWRESAGRFDAEALGVVLQTLLSGTWIGRLSEIGELLARAAGGIGSLPLALMALQWFALVAFLVVEQRVLARRLAGIERSE
jgi:hypothetical protein